VAQFNVHHTCRQPYSSVRHRTRWIHGKGLWFVLWYFTVRCPAWLTNKTECKLAMLQSAIYHFTHDSMTMTVRYLYSAPYKIGQRRWTRRKLIKIKQCYTIVKTQLHKLCVTWHDISYGQLKQWLKMFLFESLLTIAHHDCLFVP